MAVAGPATPNSELAPRLNLKAPSHLLHILEDFDEGVRLDAPNTALRALRQAFALLLGLSCDILGAASVQMGASAELYLLEKGQTPRLSDSELRIKEALYFLSQNDSGELGKLCASIFFDASGSPRQFYLLTQGAEGKMGGLSRLSDFCKEPRRAPGRSESVKLRNAYLPHLEAWLQAMNSFWDKSELLWERTDLAKQQRLLYKIHDTELEVGARIELNDCKACIPSRVLQTPEGWVRGEGFLGIAQEVPEHTLHLVDRYAAALESNDIIESTRLLRDTLEFLLRYFAGVGKLLCQELNCLTEEAERFARKAEEIDYCERLLQSCVECLKSHQDDSAARDFVGVFYRRDANLDLQPRSHTNILLLEGVLSSWFKQERGQTPSAERYTKDYERYFPLFRDWARSMGPYFSHTEHFSDPPSDHGFLPLTVRCGEHLLELIEPEYQLRIRQCPVCLPNPIWTRQAAEAAAKPKAAAPVLTAEQLLRRANTKPEEVAPPVVEEVKPVDTTPKTFPGEFRPIEIPSDTPKFLSRVLRRLDVRVRRGELSQSRDALRDALDYLLRYWAGVTFVCARDAAKLSLDEEEKASKNMTIQDCEKVLILCLKKLSEGANELSEEIIQVFYERDLFSEQLKPIGGHTRMLQTDAGSGDEMQLLAEFCEMTDPCDLHRSRRDLKTFLPVLRDWLSNSQSFFEQCQHHEEEPDKEGRMELVIQWDKTFLELVAPDFAFYIQPGSDLVPDLDVPVWVEPETPKEDLVVQKPKVITTEELALSEPFLIHKVQYVGVQDNSQGVPCKSGIISIQNAGGGSLTGRAFATHPCIEVSPNRFREKTQLQYWLDEKSIPKDFVPVLVLRSGGDERQVTLAELRPLSKLATLTKDQGTVLLLTPAVGGFLLTNAIIIYFGSKMQKELVGAPSSLRLAAPEVLNTCLGYGSYVGATFLLYGALAPILGLKVYQRFSHGLQDLVSKRFGQSLWLPIPLLLLTTLVNCVAFTGVRHKEILNANLPRLTSWGIFFVLGSSLYAHLENERKFAEWIQDPGLRKVIPAAAVAIFLLAYSLALS